MTNDQKQNLINLSKDIISKSTAKLNDDLKNVELYSTQVDDVFTNCEQSISEINNHISKLKSLFK